MHKEKKGLSRKKNEKDRLKELIRKSGLPLELEIASFLNLKKEWIVSTNPGYLDKDSHEGREIDISAEFTITDEIDDETCLHFVKLLIECKKIPGNAWIFVKPSFKVFPPPHTFVSAFDVISSSSVDAHPYIHNLHDERNCPIAIYSKEYVLDEKRSNKRDDNLYGSIVSLAKATSFEVEQETESFVNECRFALVPPDYMTYIYPIIVFDGKMYLAERKEDFILTPSEHVLLLSRYISGQYNINFGIDVVHRKAFEHFFKEIEKDLEIFRQELRSEKMQKFRGEVRKAVESYKKRGFFL